MTYPKEVEETIGVPVEVERLDHTKLEDLGLNTCIHGVFLSSREFLCVDESEPQLLPNFLPLDVNLGDKRGTNPPIKPHSPDSFRMKVVDNLTILTPPLPHVASFYPKELYFYYRPCIDDPKKHYGFKLGLFEHNGSLVCAADEDCGKYSKLLLLLVVKLMLLVLVTTARRVSAARVKLIL
ncbi:hypothetical protein Tco_1364430, partial [Tanacetum coccineum]